VRLKPRSQPFKQRFRFFQIARLKTFGKPAVDSGEKLAFPSMDNISAAKLDRRQIPALQALACRFDGLNRRQIVKIITRAGHPSRRSSSKKAALS
jgi:hypothetical protein